MPIDALDTDSTDLWLVKNASVQLNETRSAWIGISSYLWQEEVG